MGNHRREISINDIDEAQASGILEGVIKESRVFLGGAAIGKGLKKAANYYLNNNLRLMETPSHFQLDGAKDLEVNADKVPLENSFYVVDIGVVVSQVFQWRKFFPRVQPFMAVKCNPDPVIIKTLAVLGCNFDCASANEIRLVHQCTRNLPHQPEIIFANPCKPRSHILEAVCKGIRRMTFDNEAEVEKCASISKKIELVLRIITDDRGSQCRLSSKFGAPPIKWRPLLAAAKKRGLQVVGVSFHVGSGCRDATRYHEALKDARSIFDMAEKEFGMKMHLLDIGGGFPGETHSIWNPAIELDDEDADKVEGKTAEEAENVDESNDRFMFFTEIAEQVAPVIDQLFPPEQGVHVIGEPGRYLVAASSTLCCSVTSCRNNQMDESFKPEQVDDKQMAAQLHGMSRKQEQALVRGLSLGRGDTEAILTTIQEELADYSKLYANQQLANQEVTLYNDSIDLYSSDYENALDLLGPPSENQRDIGRHTVEGMNYTLVTGSLTSPDAPDGLITLAAAGEAAVNGLVMQAVADSAPMQDDFTYYVNDGVYGAFNNIMFDHAIPRPRVLNKTGHNITSDTNEDGFRTLEMPQGDLSSDDGKSPQLYSSTVFGPTCDSIDVIARSVLLPKLAIGEFLYFENMGAYTSAAASTFNGFNPSEKFYVCSVQPEYFESMIAGPESDVSGEKEGEIKDSS
ncbi:Ornithine decarboxylase [Seminavis robusta]|uniref:Ornithine decarboxylase n=1 Tax=Seminavis robusta TaxID=568900 RepID=A0A9N8HJ68_9STRA|nr:Ornithine decarboxylase [Seminavis robusta]|eukprot:Sro537_g162400.1 Ornithine decarboxylase (686) ;mRNA; r:47898-50152